jgi:hypothetical protein
MRIRDIATPLALVLAASTLAACGSAATSSTTAVPASTSASSSSAQSVASSTSSSGSSTAAETSTSSTASATASESTTVSATTTSASTTTRTETAPAFVGGNPSSAGGHDLTAAVAVLAAHGYVPVSTATYDAGDTLRLLIGRRPGTSEEHAFFFDQTIYLGTDASSPSEQIRLLDENDTEVTLGYDVYATGASQPAGERDVRFALDMGQLSALDPLPSVSARR